MRVSSKMPFLALLLFISESMYSQEFNPKNSDTLFFDDFSGNHLDREKWNVQGPDFWVNNEQQIYIDSSATIFTVKGKEAGGVEDLSLIHI